MKKTFLAGLLFWLHLPIVIIWFGLFLIPSSIWSWKIPFHFWYIAGIMILQMLWAYYLTHRFDIICPLTTWMQSLRGYSLNDKENYNYSYIAELCTVFNVKISSKKVSLVLLITLIIVTLQYLFFLFI